MHPHDPHQPPTDALLRHLADEEALLRAALANALALHDALRRGDLPGAQTAARQQGPLAADIAAAGVRRAAAAAALAFTLGLPADGLTLAALAARLAPDLAAGVQSARERLVAVTTDLTAIQARNANLLNHLRSYFRGVLSGLIAPDAPRRYGRSGCGLEPAAGSAIQRRG
jgi:hypothetical protein